MLVAAVPAVVAALLLVPRHVDLPIAWLSAPWLLGDAARGGTPLWWALEDLANIGLFLPVGFVLARWAGPVPAVLFGGSLSAVCETVQQVIPNRHASLLDVVTNVAGAALGVVLAVLVAQRRTRTSRQPHLPAVRALPQRLGRPRGLRGLHPAQTGGTVGHVQVRVVERERRRGGLESVPLVPTVAAHASMVTQGSDVGAVLPQPIR